MTIATLTARIKRNINRGAVYDADIPDYIKDAVSTLETFRNWKQMEFQKLDQVLTEVSGGFIDLVSDAPFGIRDVRFIRMKFVDGNGQQSSYGLSKIQFEDAKAMTGAPRVFYMVGQNGVQVLPKPTQDYTYDLLAYRYSDSTSDNLFWLSLSEGLLVAQTVAEMHALLRDEKVLARYKAIIAAKLPMLEDADIELSWDAADNVAVPFQREMRNDAIPHTDDPTV